jgi:eukaryotic-like serine/threonine-protein kinase
VRKLFQEMHGRSVWQVLGLYLAGGWLVLQVVDVLKQNLELPGWVFLLALVLLGIGLPLVLLTAILQGGRVRAGEPAAAGARGDGTATPGGGATGARLFTWRNAILGAGAAALLWAGVAVGWVLFGRGPDAAAGIDAVAGLDQVRALMESDREAEAYALAREIEPAFTDDSLRGELLDAVTQAVDLTSEPSGAEVWTRPYDSTEEEWERLGRTPIAAARVPRGLPRYRFALEGYEPLEVAGIGGRGPTLLRRDPDTEGFVRVPGSEFEVFLPGLEHLRIELPDFLIGKHEVTNAEFKRFVDAGGYESEEHWDSPLLRDGEEIAWTEALNAFRDQTGRPGPGTWEIGTYPDGTADHPVGGVSWYEAAAYARFAGRELPTLYHWYWAAYPHAGKYMLPHSNFDRAGTVPVGTYDGMSPFGALDMAGNVREWTWNETDAGRFILGGGWSDPEYMFTDANAQSAWNRDPINGIRLMAPLDTTNLVLAREPVVRPHRDYFAEQPVSEEIFAVYRRLYAYDPTPLNASVLATEETEHWTREEIELDAAYGGERLRLFLYLPKDGTPPYQTIVFFPGSNAIYEERSPAAHAFRFPFLIRSGRVVAFPVYKGTYERGTDLGSDIQDESNSYREHVIQWSKDLGRSIDYLETRSDVSTSPLGYFGLSWGAAMAPVMLAVEDRISASVLLSGGLVLQPAQPEVDPFNFLPRVRVPTRMINVPTDYFYPLEASQWPFFEYLGAEPKDSVLVEGGHVPPMNLVARHTLEWLDEHLGKVK